MTTATTPGYKTSEFWLKILAFVLTALYASGVVPTSGPLAQAMAIGATILGALGYTVARTMLKTKSPLIPAQVVEVPAKNPQSGRVRLTMLAVIALAAVAACSLSMSCTAAQKKAVSDFGHCEETAAVKDLEGPIKSIGDQFIEGKLTKDGALALLDSFGVSYGLDTVGCAVTFVEQAFGSKVNGSADTGAATDLYNEWLAKHGKQASADESFLKAEQGIDKATAQVAQMRAELAAVNPCDSGSLVVGADGDLTCANGITGATPGSYVPAVVACPVDNMPGSPPSSDIPCNATITLAAPTGMP